MDQDSYQPEPGETVLLTVRAKYVGDGDFRIGGFVTNRVGRHFVRVEPLPEPALPTAFGSRITATIRGSRLQLVLADPSSQLKWWAKDDAVGWHDDDELADIEVLHDPDASQPTAEAAAPEPLEMPTGLGAVVQATYGGTPVTAVLSDTDSHGAPWRLHFPDGGTGWTYADELTCTDVLTPGVEVELP